MFVTFITIIRLSELLKLRNYRDTRAYMLDPRIQEFFIKMSISKGSVNLCIRHNSVALIMTLGLENPFPIVRCY